MHDIQQLIQDYFQGIYEGDLTALKKTIHPDCLLYGDLKGTPYRKTLVEYLAGVRSRKSPKDLGENFQMKTVSMEVLGKNAIVKAQLHMLGHEYFDFLSCSKLAGKWWIVNKLFTESA